MAQVTVWPRGKRRRYAAGPLGEDRSSAGGDARRAGNPLFINRVGALQKITVGTRYEDGFGGTDLVSWSIDPHRGFVGGLFRPGDHCRITHGGGIAGEAEISEVLPQGDGSVEFQGHGYAYNLSEFNSVEHRETFVISITGGTTTPVAIENPTTKLVAALDTGPGVDKYGWEYATSELGMPVSEVRGDRTGWDTYLGDDGAQSALTLAQVVTERERRKNQRWEVYGRTLSLVPDPTEARWQIDAPEGVVGVADTDYCTHVGVWYRWWDPISWDAVTTWSAGALVTGFDGKWYKALLDVTGGGGPGVDTASWEETPYFIYPWMTDVKWAIDTDNLDRFDTRTRIVDYRGGRSMYGTGATIVAQSLLDQVKGRFFLAGSFTVGPDSGLKHIGGGKAPISVVWAGHGLKVNKLRTTQGNLLPDFVIIGKTEWTWQADGSETLTITPMGAPPRDIGTILAGVPYSPSGETAVA